MVTQFDANGLTNEAQVVSGDSGSSVFFKRNGVWELIGIVNAQYSTLENQNNTYAVYGNYTTFADLSYYRNQILSIMNANPNYSVLGDVNLDGVVSGSMTDGVPTGDIAAFVLAGVTTTAPAVAPSRRGRTATSTTTARPTSPISSCCFRPLNPFRRLGESDADVTVRRRGSAGTDELRLDALREPGSWRFHAACR